MAAATPRQIRALHIEFAERLGYNSRRDRPARLQAAAAALRLPALDSLSSLTTSQAGYLLRALRDGTLDPVEAIALQRASAPDNTSTLSYAAMLAIVAIVIATCRPDARQQTAPPVALARPAAPGPPADSRH